MFPAIQEVATHRLTGLVSVAANGKPNATSIENILCALDSMKPLEILNMLRPDKNATEQAKTIEYLTGPYYLEQFVTLDEEEKIYDGYQALCKKALDDNTEVDHREILAQHPYSQKQLDLRMWALEEEFELTNRGLGTLKELLQLPKGEGFQVVNAALEAANFPPEAPEEEEDEPGFETIHLPKDLQDVAFVSPTGMLRYREKDVHFTEENEAKVDAIMQPYLHLVDIDQLFQLKLDSYEEWQEKTQEYKQELDRRAALYLSRSRLDVRLDLDTQKFLTDPKIRRQFFQTYHYLEEHKRMVFDQILASRFTLKQKMAEDWALFMDDFQLIQPGVILKAFFRLTNLAPESDRVAAFIARTSKQKQLMENEEFEPYIDFVGSEGGQSSFLERSQTYLRYKK
jgi:hypothetical protein